MDFKVGDKVRHILRPQWGIGTVVEVDCGKLSVEVQPESKEIGRGDEAFECVNVLYPTFKGDKWGDHASEELDFYCWPHNLELVAE